MVRVNLIDPKGTWFQAEKWRGIYTIFYRQRGQMFQTCLQLHLWGLTGTKSSFYTARKVQTVIHYQPN